MSNFSRFVCTVICSALSASLFGTTDSGSTSTTLDAALQAENVDGGIINFTANVSLVEQVRAVQSDGTFTFFPNANITINGINTINETNYQLNGQNTTRGFFVGGRLANGTGSVTINHLNFVNCRAKGGDGGSGGGGGGLGAGGGLFVGENTNVILQDCTFSLCSAKGGNGSTEGVTFSGAGGGMRGNGGVANFATASGGGGFGGNGADSNSDGGGGGGASGFSAGNAGGVNAGKNFDGTGASGSPGVGGNGSTTGGVSGDSGGFGGGGGGGKDTPSLGGNGDFGGGGGGGDDGGGNGGFGGGGGAGTTSSANCNGGFGGGGGSGTLGAAGGSLGGFGGGNGRTDGFFGGGKGAGFGGAIFIQSGGKLTLITSDGFSGTVFSSNPSLANSVAAGDNGVANTNPNAGFGALGQDIFMMSEGSITFDLATSVSMPSPIQGNIGDGGGDQNLGGLTKKGSALLTLTGNNTYTGKTTIEAGELRVNGSVISELEVQSGGKLSGSFTAKNMGANLNSGKLTNSGIVSPGASSVGTINLEGEYVQTSTGILVVDVTPTGNISDKVLGATSATLAGTLEIILNPGNYIEGTSYLIIDSPTSGQFPNVVKTGTFGSHIQVGVTYSSVILTILDTKLFNHQVIQSGPSQNVVNCITSSTIVPASDFATIVEILGTLDNKAVNAALTSLSAVKFGALEWVNARNNSYAADILSQHLFEVCSNPNPCGITAWASAFGNFMHHKKPIDNLQKFDANAGGILVGVDLSHTPCFSYGGAFGYTHTDLSWKENGGIGDINNYYGALYGSFTYNQFRADLSLLGGGSDNETKRKIIFANVDRTAKGDFWGYFFTGHLGVRGDWKRGCTTFELFALTDYHYYMHKKFTESGADSLNLHVQSKHQNMMRAEGGFKCSHYMDLGYYSFSPYLGLSLVAEFPLHKSKQPASFKDQSCVINAKSYDSALYLGAPQVGLQWCFCNKASLLLGYKGLYNNKVNVHEIEGRLEWSF